MFPLTSDSHVIALIATLFVTATGAAKVLLICYPHPSHVMMTQAVGEDLKGRGHEVFFAFDSQYQIPESIRNRDFQLLIYQCQTVMQNYREEMMKIIFNNSTQAQSNLCSAISFALCECMMSDLTFLDQVRSLRFDLMLIDHFPGSFCYSILPLHLGVRYVMSTAFDLPWTYRIPALPSFYEILKPGSKISSVLSLETFTERLYNVVYTAYFNLVFLRNLWKNTSLLDRYGTAVGGKIGRECSASSWEEAFLQSELVLLHTDYHLLDSAVALPPNVVTVPGCTARPARPLPVDIQRVFSEPGASSSDSVIDGTTGVVLFSLGSYVDYVPPEVAARILGAFARISEKVLAKMIPSEDLKLQVPKNVHLQPWLPQNDILGQSNTVLFITHCGNNGLHEALYHGVPVLGIPLFSEQGWNCAQAERRGIGKCLALSDLTVDNFYSYIRELIDNSTYRLTVRIQSEIWRSEPLIGRQKAGFWVDHVIKYGGQHLRSRAAETSLYEFLMLDIILFAYLVLFGFTLIGFCLARYLLRKVSKRLKKSFKID